MRKLLTKLSNLIIIEPDIHEDSRGFFMEVYHKEQFAKIGIKSEFVQDNHSHSLKGVLRGMKFQYNKPTDKLVRVAGGSIFAVGLDIRPQSVTFGKWEGIELSSENKRLLYLPFGFAFGFCVTSASAEVLYKLSALHNEKGSGTIRWNDPKLAITWPERFPIISEGDAKASTLEEWINQGGLKTMR